MLKNSFVKIDSLLSYTFPVLEFLNSFCDLLSFLFKQFFIKENTCIGLIIRKQDFVKPGALLTHQQVDHKVL